MFKYLFLASTLLSLMISSITFAQDKLKGASGKSIDLRFFNSDTLSYYILQGINKQLQFNNHEDLKTQKILKTVAEDQAEYMATIEEATSEQSNKKKKTIEDRMVFYGGSVNALEIVTKEPVMKGDATLSYAELAYNIYFKWLGTKKTMDIFLNPEYIFAGIGAKIDKRGKKIYVSMVIGNYKSLNAGANRRNELDAPFSTRLYGMYPFEDKICKKCDIFRDIVDLQTGLSVRDGFIYFKTNRMKELSRILKDSRDGLAVEVVQKDQYPCTGDNIIDNTLPSKGILIKRYWSKKLFKRNLNKDKKKDELEIKIGKFPDNVKGDYEMNLIIIKDHRACKNIMRSYVVEAGLEYSNKVELLADTISVNGIPKFSPSVTSSNIKFTIPFERSKIDYKAQDIEPLLKQLDEPDYNINEVKVTAYSSIEGTEEKNSLLQKDRAQSIIKVLEARQKNNIKTEIITKDNWEMFKEDIKTSEYAYLSEKTVQEAQDFIRQNKLHEKLEPILAKERYAEVEMKITYDINGPKEQPFVVSMFNKAVKKKDIATALSIQKFIFKKVFNKQYGSKIIDDMLIPNELANAGLLMNKLWLEKWINNSEISSDDYTKIGKLTQLDPTNAYILYNYLYCDIIFGEIGSEKIMNERQKMIDGLYSSTLSKNTVDNLNIEYQFKIIHYYDSLSTPHPKMIASLEKIKKIVNISESNWQSSLKLAYIFIEQKDYDFAIKLIEPFIDEEKVFDELVFTYITLCTKTPQRLFTELFTKAMEKASKIDPNRFCKLINTTQLNFQVFDNTDVKDIYCNTCKGKK